MNKGDSSKGKVYPSEDASFFSRLFFCWAFPLFYKKYKNQKVDDGYQLLSSHESKKLGDKLEKIWRQQCTSEENPSFWKTLWKLFGFEFTAFAIVFLLIEFAFKMTQPYLIGKLIGNYLESSLPIDQNQTYLYGGLLLGTSFLNVLISHSYLLGVHHLGMKIRIASSALIYRKVIRLKRSSAAKITLGKLINILSNDVNRFDLAPMLLLQLMVAPIETLVVMYCLYSVSGYTSITGIMFLVLFVPVQMYIGKLSAQFRLKTAKATDQRIRLTNEIISGIQMVKMYAWELPFLKMITKTRRLEMKKIQLASNLRALNSSFMLFMNRTGIFLCILTYALVHDQIDARYVFIVSSFFAILRQALTVYFPFGITNFSETRISIERIRKFLLSEELPQPEDSLVYKPEEEVLIVHKPIKLLRSITEERVIGVTFQEATLRWSNSTENTLSKINFRATSGELVAMIGPVGGGKSSLLQAVLGELDLVEGSLGVGGTISYATQEPWIFSGTIKQNVLFGSVFLRERYRKVLEVCELMRDLQELPQGDGTLVGEKGVLLSGGQRARVSLARAVYRDVDVYLLDDPLAAVDVRVGRSIFQKCIANFLREKCTILVTHQLQYVNKPTRLYSINNRTVKVEDLILTEEIEKEEEEVENYKQIKTQTSLGKQEQESQNSGKVSKHVYRNYFKSGGNSLQITLLGLLFLLAQSAASGADYFVAFWVNIQNSSSFFTNQTCIYFYTSIILFSIIITIVRSLALFRFCVSASRNLHKSMFSSIINTTLTFFHLNSSGRILNRFSKDLGLVDEVLPNTLMDTLQIGMIVFGGSILVIFLKPWIIIPTMMMMVLFYFFRIVFLVTSRELKRLEATNRSPVFSYVTASLQGLSTIRALKAHGFVKSEFDHHQNQHTSAFYMFLISNRAFAFWLDLICVLYTTVVFVSILLTNDNEAGDIGLAVTQSMNLIGVFQWGLRQWSELENQMVSVERIVDYTELPPEDCNIPEKKIDENWPLEGAIRFKSVSLRYTPGESSVLSNINISIRPREKIGIVGRTGAGKTSLVSTLFRLFPIEGTIYIDQKDINEIPLNTLRSKISSIAQEPVLFTGTLRENLDPFGEYSDAELWSALEHVELKRTISKLDQEVFEGGGNFSVGQRQLICLARATLKKCRIIVLDEATSSTDSETDGAIQKTMRNLFGECTVLTIAHRLNTIMDVDRVLVMDNGNVVQFDEPGKLLEDPEGLFWQMVHDSGPTLNFN